MIITCLSVGTLEIGVNQTFLAFSFFFFLLWPSTVLMQQTRQAVCAVKQSILLRCLWLKPNVSVRESVWYSADVFLAHWRRKALADSYTINVHVNLFVGTL
jgi:hypothetical protein